MDGIEWNGGGVYGDELGERMRMEEPDDAPEIKDEPVAESRYESVRVQRPRPPASVRFAAGPVPARLRHERRTVTDHAPRIHLPRRR